ncbi:unnamed protein product, partial [Schistocephalus solidus]|uniref:Tick transposon n=1 Tax=Schistocephalus solidus TaxID=70667 RepID=A0A183SK73_SCHSO
LGEEPQSICLVQVVNAPVAASNRYPTLTCGSSKLVLPSGHTPDNRYDRRTKLAEGLRCCVCLHIRPLLSPVLISKTRLHLPLRSNELANRLANLPVANADTSVGNHWCQLRDTIKSTVLDVLSHARRRHQYWFDVNDAATKALFLRRTSYTNTSTALPLQTR